MATRTDYHDLTGAFPHKSSRGNQYIYLFYDYDVNAILTQPIKNRQDAKIHHAWLSLHQVLQRSGNAPNLYIMDNEASLSLGQLCDYECVAILDQYKIQVIKESKVVMQGHRNPDDGLWDIPIKKPFQHKALVIITRYKTKTELIQ